MPDAGEASERSGRKVFPRSAPGGWDPKAWSVVRYSALSKAFFVVSMLLVLVGFGIYKLVT